MSDTSDLTVLWCDHGLFVDFAIAVSPQFKRTLYYTPWPSPFPKSNNLLLGDGFDEIERVKWLWDAVLDADLVIFPDVYLGDLQVHLESIGKPVWGGRRGEALELNRVKTKELLKSLNLPVGPYKLITGVQALREFLQKHDNVWVKVSLTRGDFETFNSKSYELIEPRLNALASELGAKAEITEFIVEGDIDPATEIGYDGWTIDGQWPVRSFCGIEVKDVAFLGRVIERDELPECLTESNQALAPYFRQHGYRGWYSSEVRRTPDGKCYLTDPCCRLGDPPNQLTQMAFENWGEILWLGANGQLADPKPAFKYGALAMIHSQWALKHWQPIRFPEEIRPFVKLRNHTKIEGVDYFVPLDGTDVAEIGAVIGFGDTKDEAIQAVKDNAEQVEGYYLEIHVADLDKAEEEAKKAKEAGLIL